MPKANGKVQLCLDPARSNKVLIRPVHRGPTLNDILVRLAGVKYLKLIDASSGYHNLKLDEPSSYLTTVSFPFAKYRYRRLPLGLAPASDMLQRRIDKLFNELPYVFCITDDVLIAGFNKLDGDNDETVDKVIKYAGMPT